jgi:hypothetical protein
MQSQYESRQHLGNKLCCSLTLPELCSDLVIAIAPERYTEMLVNLAVRYRTTDFKSTRNYFYLILQSLMNHCSNGSRHLSVFIAYSSDW